MVVQVIRFPRFVTFFMLLLTSVLSFAQTPTDILDAPTMYKGYFGESHVEEFYRAAGRTDMLGKWHPNATGPDKVYRLPDGRIEVHEVKTYTGWAGKEAMKVDVNGKEMYQLSDAWLKEWEERTLKNPFASVGERETALQVSEASLKGKLVRIFDEVNLGEGKWRSSVASADGQAGVRLEENMGPIRIERLERKMNDAIAKLDKLRLGELEKSGKVVKMPRLTEFPETPKEWNDYKKIAKRDFERCTVKAGLLTADGRLIVSIKDGAVAGLLVFSLEAGSAYCQYMKGDIYKPEYEQKVMDAAIKGIAVGGTTAVAVFLGTTPHGWVVLGLGIGAYCITDAVLTQWHKLEAANYLNSGDLAHLGIEIDSVLDTNDPDILLNIGNRE